MVSLKCLLPASSGGNFGNFSNFGGVHVLQVPAIQLTLLGFLTPETSMTPENAQEY